MKKLFFLITKPYAFWVMLPPIIFLIPAVYFNESVKTMMKLYPLIIALSLLTVFFAFYLFRAVLISSKGIKCIGTFSSKEKAEIKPERTLVITVLKRKRLKLEIFGKNDDTDSGYAWLKNEEPTEINLFRATVNGVVKSAKKIIRYFENCKNEISEKEADGIKIFKIHFT